MTARTPKELVDTARAFLALNLDVASVRRVAERARTLERDARATLPSGALGTWVSPARMHVTVRFLGVIDPALAPALVDEVAPLVKGPAPRLGRARAAAFPDAEHARVLVYELEDPHEDLARLFAAVDDRVASLGLPREARPYRPHVTLARARREVDVRSVCAAAGDLDLTSARVTELVLYRSDLSPAGSEYTPLARLPWPA